ncbi:hypothetical protein COK39_17740 [Priestia megaterium]|nr:hypothetical protein COK39_17740 [Priestia megaterium]
MVVLGILIRMSFFIYKIPIKHNEIVKKLYLNNRWPFVVEDIEHGSNLRDNLLCFQSEKINLKNDYLLYKFKRGF